MTTIQEQIKQAKEAAAAAVPQGTDIIEGYVDQGGNVTTYAKPSMATVSATTGVIPRNIPFLKVNEDGIKIGKDKQYIEGFKATIDLVEDKGFQVKWTVRFGNPAQYLSTYDGSLCDKGGNWNDALRKARVADPAAEPYPSVDIVLTLAQDVKLKEETLKKGSKVAFNSSKTNFSEWSDFFKLASEAGLVGSYNVPVQIGFREINHNGNTWGVVTFALDDSKKS